MSKQVKFVEFINETGGKYLVNVDLLIGVVEHRGKVMIRTIDDRGSDTILDNIDEVVEKLAALND
jgi:hypothetical protein